MLSNENRSKLSMILAMFIFGTIGIFRKYIPWPSMALACVRGCVGAAFLVILFALRHQKISGLNTVDKTSLREIIFLILSGTFVGFNWILLFDSYNYTTVATATLCYYMAPVFVVIASPFLLKKKVSIKSWVCVAIAFVGMILISGVLDTGFDAESEGKGVILGLGAALLYACVIILNKKIKSVEPLTRTILQLGIAGIVLVPFSLVKGEFANLDYSLVTLVFVALVCILHTGIAYVLYFGTLSKLNTQTIALFSYIDPIVAVVLSVMLLREPMKPTMLIGAILILGAMAYDELKH